MNSKFHLIISYIKSIIRIVACGLALSQSSWCVAVVGLIVAEVLGLVEEIGDKR